jgi:hypothetical protein
MLERYGDMSARAYTAFMFFNVLLEHLKAPSRNLIDDHEKKWQKPHTAATRYLTLYAAGDAVEAALRDRAKVNVVLDRSFMWDSPRVPGCQSKYCFQNGNFNSRRVDGAVISRNFMMTAYPCPSPNCYCARSHLAERPDFENLPPCHNEVLMGPRVFFNVTLDEKAAAAGNVQPPLLQSWSLF